MACTIGEVGRDSLVGTATGYGLDVISLTQSYGWVSCMLR
jgi:hypothetical protein